MLTRGGHSENLKNGGIVMDGGEIDVRTVMDVEPRKCLNNFPARVSSTLFTSTILAKLYFDRNYSFSRNLSNGEVRQFS
mgnify:CR=1 FL=1